MYKDNKEHMLWSVNHDNSVMMSFDGGYSWFPSLMTQQDINEWVAEGLVDDIE